VLRSFSYPKVVAPRGALNFESWWENKGVSPIYRKYPVALRFRNAETTSRAVLAGADLRDTVWIDSRLRGAELRAAEFDGADLRGADLGEFPLQDAHRLAGATISAIQAAVILGQLGIVVDG
jgi:hypothetical protein